ncbi:MAG TPA: hypothetical protein VE861_04190 [Gemmatimonadaceae bacterium]|nr:hypothetical protein [Gemmatimonadaceae bacterium]
MTVHVIGIDPGLDGAGMAWLAQPDRDTIHVRDVVTVRTKPADPMCVRLLALSQGVLLQLRAWQQRMQPSLGRVDFTVVLEVPQHVGRSDHARKQGRENVNAKSMAAFWQAMGVIRAAIAESGLPLVELPPGGAKKEVRQALYIRWTHAGKNADERDAIVTACTQLFATAPVAAIATLSARP